MEIFNVPNYEVFVSNQENITKVDLERKTYPEEPDIKEKKPGLVIVRKGFMPIISDAKT